MTAAGAMQYHLETHESEAMAAYPDDCMGNRGDSSWCDSNLCWPPRRPLLLGCHGEWTFPGRGVLSIDVV